MKTKVLIILGIWCLVIMSWCQQTNTQQEPVQIANPASEFCEQNWWALELIFDNWESYGVCNFEDWSFCEEREYYRGECQPKWNTTLNLVADSFESCTKLGNPIQESYPRKCTSKDWITFVEGIDELTVCPSDAKICPDWSVVTRTWNECHFETCATNQNNNQDIETINDIFDEYKKSDAINNTWLTQEDIDLMEKVVDKLK